MYSYIGSGYFVVAVVILFEQTRRLALLEDALVNCGLDIAAGVKSPALLKSAVIAHNADLVIVDVALPGKDVLNVISEINRNNPLPVVLFSGAVDNELIEDAVNSGVSAHVIDCVSPERIQSIVKVTQARFKKIRKLEIELEKTRERLADHGDVEKVKGRLMKSRHLTEEEAYNSLRKLAMDQNISLGDAARTLLSAMELLG